MKYLDEYRDAGIAHALAARNRRRSTRPWVLMEFAAGRRTPDALRHRRTAAAERCELVHGPGCPVCVTPLEIIDRAIESPARPEVTWSRTATCCACRARETDLFHVKAEGGDVRVVYSPTGRGEDLARSHPARQVVFFAIGFETTAPANAMAVWQAERLGLRISRLLVSHVLVPPAIRAAAELAEKSRAGIHRARARLHRDGHARLRRPGARIPRADCRGRI